MALVELAGRCSATTPRRIAGQAQGGPAECGVQVLAWVLDPLGVGPDHGKSASAPEPGDIAGNPRTTTPRSSLLFEEGGGLVDAMASSASGCTRTPRSSCTGSWS